MSSVVIAGDVSGTVTLDAPAVAGTTVLTLPATSGTVFVGGQALSATTGSFSGNVTLGSSVLATPTGSAPSYLCRAWVNFNGTGTVAIRASGNVSSITDNGTGDYTVNFTNAMPDADFAAVAGAGNDNTNTTYFNQMFRATPTASSVRFATTDGASTSADRSRITVAIFR